MILGSTGTLANLSYWVGILGFVMLAMAAILAPIVSGRRTVKKVNTANGATKKSNLDVDRFKDYNLYDLCLQALINSERAHEEAKAARCEVKKISNKLGIEGE